MKLKLGMTGITHGVRLRIGMSLAFGLFCTSSAPAGGPLFEVTEYSAGEVAWSLAIGDLDGDQVTDLVVGNLISRDISVFRGIGDGSFAAVQTQAVGEYPLSIAIADLNGDQVLDIALAGDGVRVLPGIGNGTFGAAVPYDPGNSTSAVAIADLNGDQMPDLVVTNGSKDNVSVLLGVGGGFLYSIEATPSVSSRTAWRSAT